MKIFVSSVITGMRAERLAAREAIAQLGHDPILAEDFGARPQSPQVACLSGVRESAAVVLLVGADYGTLQPSGRSATHEEYREARESRPVFAFVQNGVTRNAEQTAFLTEVQHWATGVYRGTFASAEELRREVTKALHQCEVGAAARPLNAQELVDRAIARLPNRDRHRSSSQGPLLVISIAGGPTQNIVRPSELEAPALANELTKEALFWEPRILDIKLGTEARIESDGLIIRQEKGGSITLNGEGSVLLQLPIPPSDGERFVQALIQEEVAEVMAGGLTFAAWVLDKIDATQRLSHVAIAATIANANSVTWRTLAEQRASPNSYSMRLQQEDDKPVHLSPAHIPRSALTSNIGALVSDLITVLRRRALS